MLPTVLDGMLTRISIRYGPGDFVGTWLVKFGLVKQNIVSDLSLRFSYGYQRNMATNYSPSLIVKVPSSSASSAVTDQNTGDDLLEISSLPYEDLRWEKTSLIITGWIWDCLIIRFGLVSNIT